MPTSLQIALRFLGARKRAMLMSLTGIVFGVAFFILTQAQTAGFESYFIRTILGVNGMIRIEDRMQYMLRTVGTEADSNFSVAVEGSVNYIPGVQFPGAIIDAVQQIPGISAASPVLRGNATLKAHFRDYDIKPYGIDVKTFLAVSDLENQVIAGSMLSFGENPYGLLVGSRIALRLNLQTGDSVLLESAHAQQRFRISGIYETGIEQVDRERVYLHLTAAKVLLGNQTGVSFVQINARDPSDAPYLARRIQQMTKHYTMEWQEREKTWLQVFSVLRISSALTISTIILISGLGMFNTLVMIVSDKTREIAILRSMGYTRNDISQIFLLQGGIVLGVGVTFGCLAAAAGTYGLSKIPIHIRGIFAADHFVVEWSLSHYIWAVVVAVVVVMIASYFPARRAARLEPGAVIRGSAS